MTGTVSQKSYRTGAVEPRPSTTLKRFEGAGQERTSELLTLEELQQQVEVDWLIQDVLPANRIAMLYGYRSSYKTFLALDMALAIATGQPWQGERTHQGSVVYISGEGKGGLGLRVTAWARKRKVAIDESQIRFRTNPINFRNPDEVKHLLWEFNQDKIQPRLVVVDTLARCFGGGEENGSVDMGQFVHGIDTLRRATGATVLVLHHPGDRSIRPRGHTSLDAATDTLLHAYKPTRSGVTLICRRQKDEDEFATMHFERELIHIGPAQKSLILVANDKASKNRQPEEAIEDRKATRFLEAVTELGEEAFAGNVGEKIELSDNKVNEYAKELEERGLITIEPGVKHNRTRKNRFIPAA